MTVYCSISLDKQQKNHFEEFEEAIIHFPEVIECSVISGNYDYLIKVIVKNMEAYNDFYQKKLSDLQSVAHISSSFVMSEVKNTTVLPL